MRARWQPRFVTRETRIRCEDVLRHHRKALSHDEVRTLEQMVLASTDGIGVVKPVLDHAMGLLGRFGGRGSDARGR